MVLVIKKQIITAASVDISINSLTAAKNSDTVYEYLFKVSPNFFQVSVYGSLKQKKSLNRKASKCPRPLTAMSTHGNEYIQSLYGSSKGIL